MLRVVRFGDIQAKNGIWVTESVETAPSPLWIVTTAESLLATCSCGTELCRASSDLAGSSPALVDGSRHFQKPALNRRGVLPPAEGASKRHSKALVLGGLGVAGRGEAPAGPTGSSWALLKLSPACGSVGHYPSSGSCLA